MSSLDPAMLFAWLKIILVVGIPVAMALWGVWKKNESIEAKIKDSAPIIWNVVQQELRKNGGKLPNGQSPLDYALGLFGKIVPLSASQKALAEMALKAYHESQGAPDPGEPPAVPGPAK